MNKSFLKKDNFNFSLLNFFLPYFCPSGMCTFLSYQVFKVEDKIVASVLHISGRILGT